MTVRDWPPAVAAAVHPRAWIVGDLEDEKFLAIRWRRRRADVTVVARDGRVLASLTVSLVDLAGLLWGRAGLHLAGRLTELEADRMARHLAQED